MKPASRDAFQRCAARGVPRGNGGQNLGGRFGNEPHEVPFGGGFNGNIEEENRPRGEERSLFVPESLHGHAEQSRPVREGAFRQLPVEAVCELLEIAADPLESG